METPQKLAAPHVASLGAEGKEVLKAVVALDGKVYAAEQEYDKEHFQLQDKYEKEFAPVLSKRLEFIAQIPGFWATVLQRSDEFGGMIMEHDEPVLEALTDIKCEPFADRNAGFKLHFHFAENEFFTNKVLTKTYYTKQSHSWDTSLEFEKVESDKIQWKEGMDVTIEKVEKKKVKGGGKKKAKAKAAADKFVARASFFRYFKSLGDGFEIPTDVESDDEDEEESDDEDSQEEAEDKMDRLLNEDGDNAETLRDTIIPHAVRYYTHEAGSDDEDEDDDDDEVETPK
jgi:nucleosome assembly protein 1-like 1